VLSWPFNGTGASIVAGAIRHAVYNVVSGSAADTGVIAGVTSSLIDVQAFLLVGLELRARRRGERSILDPHPQETPQASASLRSRGGRRSHSPE
jgi:hypothetical protein